jgi:plasmid stability protein
MASSCPGVHPFELVGHRGLRQLARQGRAGCRQLQHAGQELDVCAGDCIYIVLLSSKADKRLRVVAILTVRNVPDEVHRALRVRAAQHGRSTEAEVREILAAVVKPEKRVRVGEALQAIGRKIGLTNEDLAVLESVRDKTPARPLSFD